MASSSMGFWRSLREWWRWDGSPDTDPFRHSDATGVDEVSGDVQAHAELEAAPQPTEETDD